MSVVLSVSKLDVIMLSVVDNNQLICPFVSDEEKRLITLIPPGTFISGKTSSAATSSTATSGSASTYFICLLVGTRHGSLNKDN